MTFGFHPFSEIFPLMTPAEFAELVADIAAHGQREDIVRFEGMILDGRNRYRACLEAGPVPKLRDFDPRVDGDPLQFVISKNLKRRHLSESQRGMIAARMARLGQGARTDLGPRDGQSQAERAATVWVGTKTVERADRVLAEGIPELIRAVETGALPVKVAAEAVRLPAAQQQEVVAEAAAGRANVVRTIVKKQRRAQREGELGLKQLAAPTRQYGVILADDEWDFEVRSRETGMDRHAANHYPVSETAHTAEEIHERTKERFACAAEDSVCAMWSTVPHLAIALRLMELRGYRYVTNFNWSKDRVGTGYWNRNKHEHLLIGVRGSIPAPAMGTQFDSDLPAPVRGHSVKPDWQYELLEAYFPNLPKIELNARRARSGWVAWGLEAPETEGDNSGPGAVSDGDGGASLASPRSASSPFAPPPKEQRPAAIPDDEIELPAFLRRQAS